MSAIVEAILFLGMQKLPLRGHRDSGPILLETPAENGGNFRSLLRFREASRDQELNRHLFENLEPTRRRYTSPDIQNELNSIIGELVQNHIVSKINAAGCFAVLADETTDIGGIEQFSLCACYLVKTGNRYVLRENFLTFVTVQDRSGEGLSKTLLTSCEKLKLNMNFLCGQGYDGASAMRGHIRGCSAWISHNPQALSIVRTTR